MGRHPVLAAALVAALVLSLAACAGNAAPAAATPFAMRLVDIQSATVRLGLHQVMRIDTAGVAWHFTARIADERIVRVVEHRNEGDGSFEPELVPLRIGRTQVALVSSVTGQAIIGFTVVVTAAPVEHRYRPLAPNSSPSR